MAAKSGDVSAQEALDKLEVPERVRYLYDWFFELKWASLRAGMGTVVTFTEIDAWSRLYQRQLAPWEVGVIRQLDLTFNSALDKKKKRKGDDK